MMEARETAVPDVERLTWKEICERYPDEWVVLVDTDWQDLDNFEFDRAVVLCHAKGRSEIYRHAKPLLTEVMDAGIFFTGRVSAPAARTNP
jgi:hypothetical protein